MNTQAIALHLSIAESAIVEIQEWASVLWVKFTGGCRFVSKKINKVSMGKPTKVEKAHEIANLIKAAGYGQPNVWTGGKHVRIYVGKGYIEVLSKDLDCRKLNHAMAYEVVRNLKIDCEEGQPQGLNHRTACLNCGITNSILISGYCTDCHGEC